MLIEVYGKYIQAIGAQISLQDAVNWMCQCISRVKCQLPSEYQVDMYGNHMGGSPDYRFVSTRGISRMACFWYAA